MHLNQDANNKTADVTATHSTVNDYPFYAVRIWHGMSFSVFFNLLREHRFDIRGRTVVAATAAFLTATISIANRVQSLLFKRAAMATPLVADPIFIIGHWRTGTTYLHSLLAQDEQLWAPTNYECFAPRQFLWTKCFAPYFLGLPSRRPMDDVTIRWDDPQEDEFAICVNGAPTTYRNIAFPLHPVQELDSLTLEGLPPNKVDQWKSAMREFVNYLNYGRRRQLVMKSPPHTGKISTLLEMYPNAKFIHITRAPHQFIPSTIHLWNALNQTNGFQRDVSAVNVEDYVFDCFHRLYDEFDARKSLIPAANYCEVAFSDLTTDADQTVERIYKELNLGGYSDVQAKIAQYVESKSSHKKNQLPLSAELSARIDAECQQYIETYCSGTESSQQAA